MEKKEYKLTVDDLIVEYMVYKVKNGYEPQFTISEFMDFLHFFEPNMEVEDILDDGEALFKRFFERKNDNHWAIKDWITNQKYVNPHMDIIYSEKDSDYIIKANNDLNDFDISVINTYYMDGGRSKYNNFKGTAWKIRNIIGEYLVNQPKRVIDENTEVTEEELLIGKYLAAEIISQIWLSYVDTKIKERSWPSQCRDINQYLFDIDLAKIINVKSIKDELFELYNIFSKRIAILYHQDKKLQVSSSNKSYLARANYELLTKGYEKIMAVAFGSYQKSLYFDLASSTFKESHEIDGVYDWDEEPDVKTTTTKIDNERVRRLIKNIETSMSK